VYYGNNVFSSWWIKPYPVLVLLCIRCVFLQLRKGKGQYICIAPYIAVAGNLLLKHSGTATRCQGSHSFNCTPTRLSADGMNHSLPAFAFPAEAGTHLHTPNGWKVELAWAIETVSEQSAQDCYSMFIAAANRSKHHPSLGK